MILEKYSFGIGDRFGRAGKALLTSIIKAKKAGVNITPVFNKSHREHTLTGTKPEDTRKQADEAVKACGWQEAYFVDADHINLTNVDLYIQSADFFTIDVADFIGRKVLDTDIDHFISQHKELIGTIAIEGMDEDLHISCQQARGIAEKFLLSIKQAGRIYRHICSSKGIDNFVTEISMDETDQPTTPEELLFILAAIADERIPCATIAPRFIGQFNKGIDYVGDCSAFARQFEQYLAVISFAVKEFGLPSYLKLSIHSGSDKFSIYPIIAKALKKFNAGLHVKTAGTTWLEELIALASAGGEGLAIAKQVYIQALQRFDELARPYLSVIDIDRSKLPAGQIVSRWDEEDFVSAARHDPSCRLYNPHLRQLLHIAYKIAAEMGERYINALEKYEANIAPHITDNIYSRHIKPIFMPA